VSVEAICWALNLAPVPADRGGQPSSACKFVLVGLANHAGPDGTAAFPSVATLVRYTGLSERTVRTCLDRLAAEGIISPCDPDIVAARIKRADRRPQGWDLNLTLVRHDLDDAALAVLEHQFPGLGARLAATAQPGADGVQSPHPVATEGVDNPPNGVQPLHPAPGRGATGAPTGCNSRRVEVQRLHPNRTRNHPWNPPPPRARRHLRPMTLTAAQRARLAPAVATALNAGWTPRALVAFTGRNTDGVRNPYAVLAARLSPAGLPPPAQRPPARPPWCGECDERTRMLGFDGDAPRPCRRCKPTPATSTTGQAEAAASANAAPDTRASPFCAGR
jgi:Helix-turn-helix domain